MHIDLSFSPREYESMPAEFWPGRSCVVLDILRATTTMVSAFLHGAASIIPVATISEALDLERRLPGALLAGERNGRRITSQETGSRDFDLGNSPREMTSDKVKGKTLIMTTTNGTRALHACRHAKNIWIGCFWNLQAVARRLTEKGGDRVHVVCSGTADDSAFEDTLAAGALAELLTQTKKEVTMSDSVLAAWMVYRKNRSHLGNALERGKNGARLLSMEDLRDDVPVCAEWKELPFVPAMNPGNEITLAGG